MLIGFISLHQRKHISLKVTFSHAHSSFGILCIFLEFFSNSVLNQTSLLRSTMMHGLITYQGQHNGPLTQRHVFFPNHTLPALL